MFDRPKNLSEFFVEFYEVISGPRIFQQDPAWEPTGQPKGQKKNMFDRPKNLTELLLNFTKSYQDFTFYIRIQDGSPRDNQRN